MTAEEYRELAEELFDEYGTGLDGTPCVSLVMDARDALRSAAEQAERMQEMREALEKMPMAARFEMWKRDIGKQLEGAERALFEYDMQDAADSARALLERDR